MAVSALQAPEGLATVYSPPNTPHHHPYLEVIYLHRPLKGRLSHPEFLSIFPWNKGGKRPFLPRPFSLEPAFSSFIAIHEGTSGNVGYKSPNNGPEGMSLRRYTASQLVQQTLNGHKRNWVFPQVRTEWKLFLCSLQRKPIELAVLSEGTTKECMWT